MTKRSLLQVVICGYWFYYSSRVKKLAIKLNNLLINGQIWLYYEVEAKKRLGFIVR
ncbi:hypothetical protein [Psychrobacter sp. HII-4]|uniref:hypothetical protein n=1 Tax=Psychrobacter sp. HII-4 TaxID=1569264 RepID=UPI001918FDC7|nr:hypothetical protein [Psychrobacter sp. HII-4]